MLRISKVMCDACPDPDPTFSSDTIPISSGFHFVSLEAAETG
jgi:hypothetical protein